MILSSTLLSVVLGRKLRHQGLAKVHDYDEMAEIVNYDDDYGGVAGRSGMPERFFNLYNMLNHYKSDFNFAHTFQYGCNCLFKNSKDMSQVTLGRPVDAHDSLCKRWKTCMRCAERQYGSWCTNEDFLYSVTGVGPGFLKHHQGGDDAICTDGEFTCGRALCECDKMFGREIEAAMQEYDVERHVFLYGWNPYNECVQPPSSGNLECCSSGASAFTTFNTETHVCCGDGSTAISLSECPLMNEPVMMGGYGR